MGAPLLSIERVRELQAAAIQARLSRASLLAGVDRRFVASLPAAPTPGDLLLSDLAELSSVGALSDGSVPLRTWLHNAIALSGLRSESKTFVAALAELDATLAEPDAALGGAPQRGGAGVAGAADPGSPRDLGSRRRDAMTARNNGTDVVRVYVSATREDLRFVELLERHLAPLVGGGAIEPWHRHDQRCLRPGDDLNTVPAAKLEAADIVLAFISASYLADPVTEAESRAAMRLSQSKGTRVVPILARPAMWKMSDMGGLKPLPKTEVPLSSSTNLDQACTEIAESIVDMVQGVRGRRASGATPEKDDPFRDSANRPRAAAATPAARSLVDQVPFPWAHPNATKLRDRLADMYSDRDIVFNIARRAGIATGRIPLHVGAEPLWSALLGAASDQGKLRALLEVVLTDPYMAAYEAEIRSLAGI